jgi:hypothetical protein
MKNWYAKLPDWRMVFAWLVLTFVATVFYFFPAARLIDAFADYDALEGGPRRRRRCETRGSAAPAAPLIWLRAQQNKFLKISLGGAHVAKSLQ